MKLNTVSERKKKRKNILEITARRVTEPAGDTFIAHRHTTRLRRAARGAWLPFEQTYSPGQYTMPAYQPPEPGAPRLRLLTFVVSVRGALGSEAQTFIRPSSGRSLPGWRGRIAGAMPYRLLDEASWARAGPRRAVLPSSALRSPSLLAGRLLLAHP